MVYSLAAQPLGHPEILKKSLTRCTVEGGEELFIIGKNFVNKNTSVKLQEMDAAGAITWEGNCEIDKSLFHNVSKELRKIRLIQAMVRR